MKILTAPQSGSQAGTTASRNRFGQYLRSRAIPVQPRTSKQTAIRAGLTIGSAYWRALSDTERTAWNDFAAQIQRSDSLGSNYAPTGAELLAGAVATVGGNYTGITNPPAVLPNWTLAVSSITYTDPTPGPEAFTVDTVLTSADNKMIVETSGPVSPGVMSAAAVRRWRSLPETALNLRANLFSLAATPVDILTQYKYIFPSPTSGQVLWFRFKEIYFDNGTDANVANRLKLTMRFVVP